MAAATATGPATPANTALTWGQTVQNKYDGYIKFLGDNTFACVKKLSLNEGDGLLKKIAKVAAGILAVVLAPFAIVVGAFKWAVSLCSGKEAANKQTADPVANAKKALEEADAAVVAANTAVVDAEAAAKTAADAQKVADDALAAKAGDAELTTAATKAKETADAANTTVTGKKAEAATAVGVAATAKTTYDGAVETKKKADEAAKKAAEAAESVKKA